MKVRDLLRKAEVKKGCGVVVNDQSTMETFVTRDGKAFERDPKVKSSEDTERILNLVVVKWSITTGNAGIFINIDAE